MWARLDTERLADALTDQSTLGAACYPALAWRAFGTDGNPDPMEAFALDGDDDSSLFDDGDEDDDDFDESSQEPMRFPEWVRQTRPTVRRWLLRSATMQASVTALDGLALPIWANSAQLAQALQLSTDDLGWLARPHWLLAPRGHESKHLSASHYRHRLINKARGGLRLLEVPKQQLAATQRHILEQLLNRIPVHEAAHGFVAGRSVHTHAATHAKQATVCAFDLRDFFHSISAAQIRALWRSLGYPSGIANELTALTTVVTPRAVRERLLEDGSISRNQARRLALPHLAQGAPTSPALANLCAFRLDMRLAALAEKFSARYSRYADDMVFSGPAHLRTNFASLHGWVRGIASDEGFVLHPEKTRRMPSHKQQRVTGLIVNETPNLPRKAYDQLRAELHQLSRQSSVPRALKEKLQGRVAWACDAVSPSRREKLRAMLAQIPFASA